MSYTSSQLRRWSYGVRCRDEWRCQMCQRLHNPLHPAGKLEAHHIWPKALYPEFALDAANGITLCWMCHRLVVHATVPNWRQYVALWKGGYMRRGWVRRFNHALDNMEHTMKELKQMRVEALDV